MNQSEFIYNLNHPENVSESDINALTKIIDEFPYFQSARALYLKGLHAQRSYLYNNELRKTAAFTTDRDVLFDFIISEEFINYRPINIEDVNVYEETIIEIKKPEPTLEENIEKSILSTIAYIENSEKDDEIISKIESKTHTKQEDSNTTFSEIEEENNKIKKIEEKLEIGKPVTFQENEKHSFSEWLKLTKTQPIERNIEQNSSFEQEIEENNELLKKKKTELIDRFIETNPKIVPTKNAPPIPINIDKTEEDQSLLMTETLAKIYLEQKKYQKAIQAYHILILKYPEKSSLFANRIEDIKALQQYNN